MGSNFSNALRRKFFPIFISSLLLFSILGHSSSRKNIGQIAVTNLSDAEKSYEVIANLSHKNSEVLYFNHSEGNGRRIVIATGQVVPPLFSRLIAWNSSELSDKKTCSLRLNQPQIKPLLYGVDNTIRSGITEFKADILLETLTHSKRVPENLVISRHALINYLSSENSNPQSFFNDKKFFQVIDSETNKFLDIIFISSNFDDLQREIKATVFKNPSQQSWISWQFGSLGQEASYQCSEGQKIIEEVTSSINLPEEFKSTGFYGLPIIDKLNSNLTSPGSSGAVVWTIGLNKNIHALGIVQCLQEQPKGSSIQSVVRVLGFNRISNGIFQEVSIEDLKQSSLSTILSFKHCTPINRGPVGGD